MILKASFNNLFVFLDLLAAAFPAETPSRGRAYIRQKLNNADKICKRKSSKFWK